MIFRPPRTRSRFQQGISCPEDVQICRHILPPGIAVQLMAAATSWLIVNRPDRTINAVYALSMSFKALGVSSLRTLYAPCVLEAASSALLSIADVSKAGMTSCFTVSVLSANMIELILSGEYGILVHCFHFNSHNC